MRRLDYEVHQRPGGPVIDIYAKAPNIPKAHGAVQRKFKKLFPHLFSSYVRHKLVAVDPNTGMRTHRKPKGLKTYRCRFRKRHKPGRKRRR